LADARLPAREQCRAGGSEAGQCQRRRELQHDLTMSEPCALNARPALREGLE